MGIGTNLRGDLVWLEISQNFVVISIKIENKMKV